MNRLEDQLCQFYVELNLIPEKYGRNTNDPLRARCRMGAECWKGIDAADGGHGMILPWIGASYEKTRVLVLGINMNDCGSLYALDDLINNETDPVAARKAFLAGQYRHFADAATGYRGTMLYYRLAHLGAAIEQICTGTFSGRLQGVPQAVANGFDWIAYTNHVKCSPKADRSRPTEAMWQNCGRHILIHELQFLQPRFIVAFGSGDNYERLCNTSLEARPMQLPGMDGNLQASQGLLSGEPVKILSVPHPSSRQGMSDETFHNTHTALWKMMIASPLP